MIIDLIEDIMLSDYNHRLTRFLYSEYFSPKASSSSLSSHLMKNLQKIAINTIASINRGTLPIKKDRPNTKQHTPV